MSAEAVQTRGVASARLRLIEALEISHIELFDIQRSLTSQDAVNET